MKKSTEVKIFRVAIVLWFPFVLIWNVALTAISQARDFFWYTFWSEPRCTWEEFRAAYRRGEP